MVFKAFPPGTSLSIILGWIRELLMVLGIRPKSAAYKENTLCIINPSNPCEEIIENHGIFLGICISLLAEIRER